LGERVWIASSLGNELLVLEMGEEVLLGNVLGILEPEDELVVKAGDVGNSPGSKVVGGDFRREASKGVSFEQQRAG
jgi:hypothetical protein